MWSESTIWPSCEHVLSHNTHTHTVLMVPKVVQKGEWEEGEKPSMFKKWQEKVR